MVIAALIAFAGLLAAWLLAPSEPAVRAAFAQPPEAVDALTPVAEAA